ncbi:MAG: HipA N-terminal domain-containing protein [Deltaproteobacteria bacterium]
MRRAEVAMNGIPAGILEEIEVGRKYRFTYLENYQGSPVSLTMPVEEKEFVFDRFPPYFDGLLPEGILLESLLKLRKIDKYDYFGQLIAVGNDLVGAVTVQEIKP